MGNEERFSSNSEASASELQENLEKSSPLYYMDTDVISKFKSLTTHRCVTRRERVNIDDDHQFCIFRILLIVLYFTVAFIKRRVFNKREGRLTLYTW